MKYSFKNQWVVGLLGAAIHFFRPVFLEGALDSRVFLDCEEAGQRRKVFGSKTVLS